MKFVITPVALQDLQDAIDYYNHRQIGLGRRFEEIVIALLAEFVTLQKLEHLQRMKFALGLSSAFLL